MLFKVMPVVSQDKGFMGMPLSLMPADMQKQK